MKVKRGFLYILFIPVKISLRSKWDALKGRHFTPFNLSIADLYIIILPKAELLYIKGDLSVTK